MPWIDICIKRNWFTTESIRISDMHNFAVCLQIDPESYDFGLSARDQLTLSDVHNKFYDLFTNWAGIIWMWLFDRRRDQLTWNEIHSGEW